MIASVSAPPAARRARHFDDVGALTGLRHRQAGAVGQLQRRLVDRRDRRPDRGDRHAQQQLADIFQIGRHMVRRSARDRGQEPGVQIGDGPCGHLDRVRSVGQQTLDRIGDFQHFPPHSGFGCDHLRAFLWVTIQSCHKGRPDTIEARRWINLPWPPETTHHPARTRPVRSDWRRIRAAGNPRSAAQARRSGTAHRLWRTQGSETRARYRPRRRP